MAFRSESEIEDTHINVTTTGAVGRMVTALAKLPRDGKSLSLGIDCEGVNLGRHGETCYIQIRDYVAGQTYLVDLLTLDIKAWKTASIGKDNNTTRSNSSRMSILSSSSTIVEVMQMPYSTSSPLD